MMETFIEFHNQVTNMLSAFFGEATGFVTVLFSIPLVIGMYGIISYPFDGDNGLGRFWAFFIMAILPTLCYAATYGPFINNDWSNHSLAGNIPLFWCGLIWIFSLAGRLAEDKQKRDEEKEKDRKGEASNIVKRLQDRK